LVYSLLLLYLMNSRIAISFDSSSFVIRLGENNKEISKQ